MRTAYDHIPYLPSLAQFQQFLKQSRTLINVAMAIDATFEPPFLNRSSHLHLPGLSSPLLHISAQIEIGLRFTLCQYVISQI